MTSTAGTGRITSGVVDEAMATLSLQGDDLDPQEVTDLLGVTPHKSHRKGEPISKWRDDQHAHGAWSYEVRLKAPDGPDAALSQLLAMLPSDLELWASLTQRYQARVDLALVVKAWSRGFDLPAPVIQQLAARGLAVWCEVYAEPQPLASGCA